MDLVPYVSAAQDFLSVHPGYDAALGAFMAVLGSHPLQCADVASGIVARIPPLRYLLKRNWPEIKDFMDKFEDRFGANLADDAPPAPPNPLITGGTKPCPPPAEGNMAGAPAIHPSQP